MKTKFSQNIKALRKEQHITQEQLAEAMCVTAGAVYKWEQELSTPDISLIMELASFFGVSVDALVGYEVNPSDKERILRSLKRIRLEKDYENCWDEVETWLRRYPNDFDIVYNSGVLYNLVGIEAVNHSYLARSITLMKHACSLIEQNKDPEISEISICREIAMVHLISGNIQEGLEFLKAHNPCGINNSIIGQTLSENLQQKENTHHKEEAFPYLSAALIQSSINLYRVVIGFFNLFQAQKDYHSAIEILKWMISLLDGLKSEEGSSFLDKDKALLLALCGKVYEEIGNLDAAKAYLRKAHNAALEFDAGPDYTSRHIRYCEALPPRVAYDNIGNSAMNMILNLLQEETHTSNDRIFKLWEEICQEE